MPESSQELSNKSNDNSVTNDEVSDTSSSAFPGRILRAAREELNYSIEQVAQELHLRPSVVLAMEEEKYEDFSSDVFLKGYFRSYCRLVNLHEERMVDLLESQLKGLQKDIDDAAHLIKKEQQVKKRKKVFGGLLLVTLIVGVLFFLITWFYPTDKDTFQAEPLVEKLSLPTGSVVANSQNEVLKNAKVLDTEKKSPKTVIASVGYSVNTDAVIKDKPVMEDKVDQTVISEVEKIVAITSTDKEKHEKELAVEPKVEPVVEILAAKVSIFEAVFTGDCWFKLTDGNQKTVFAALKRKGDRISYSGITPFKVVLGDASKALLTFEGESINLKSHTANNGRAQLTLNKG